MDRKWRTNRAAIFTVVPYAEYCSRILQRTAEYDLATPSDLYAVYTVLHIESKTSELHWSESGGFYYFLATWSQAPEPDQTASAAQPVMQAGAPPAQGKEAAPCMSADQGSAGAQAQCAVEVAAHDRSSEANGAGAVGAVASPLTSPDAVLVGSQAADSRPPPAPITRSQIIVPVGSACTSLTPALLQRFFSIRGVAAQQLLLALVDGNGMVSRTCLFNYIQAPLEGPGTADLDLLDD
uniref:Uncharacterized protein n=1 Tax=Auxenochlorella protothecoides TaxID=3075 RepID=A0A1D2ACN0_AUXPR